MDFIKKLCSELPITFNRGKFLYRFPPPQREVEPEEDLSLEVDRIMKYLGDKDYADNVKTIIGVPRDLLIRKEDRNYVIYYLPLNNTTYDHYKKRLCRMLAVKEKKKEEI